jgi:fumarylacetoacetate (FAA) hydrolase
MIPQWYQIPVFYFSNPASVIGDGDVVLPPKDSTQLDFELEIAAVIGKEARDLPATDAAMDCVAGFTVYNDWSARDLQRNEMAVGLGPSKGKDFANAFGPGLIPLDELRDCYIDGRLRLKMKAFINDKLVSDANSDSMYWTWPQLLAHASRDTRLMPGDIIGSGTVGTGCILELTPEAVGGWLQTNDVVRLEVERLGTLTNKVGSRH